MSSDGVTRVSVEISGSEISFETGRMAKQASGAVVVRQGDTMVLCTAVAGSLRDVDFLPLTVDVEERMYASGKIPGSFFKREGRPGEKGTLTARMIDRPIRPLFPKEWRYDTQLVAIPLSIDHEHPYDILAMNGASTALMISDIPLPTPVGAVRIGKIDGNFVVNPNEADLLADAENASDLDLIVAGTEEAILMVEAGANEIPEAEILDALDIAHAEIKKLCALQRELAEKVGKEKKVFETIAVDEKLLDEIRTSHGKALDDATQVEDKLERQETTKAVEAAIVEHYAPSAPEGASEEQLVAAKQKRSAVQMAFDKLEKSIIRERIAVHKKRPDGRAENEIRDISIEVGVTPRTHGSALFTRGQTQALSVVAMGTLKEEMRLDTLGLETKKYYWHHYNFPPFSVGEAGRMGGVKRRDIGHGALAERALAPMVPSIEDFPYSIRVVSDILESNGSSSMASVCGSSLSLMDAGVPIKRPVAGIAMGLIKEGDDYIVLTDIAGVEDHLGDMDFKVAGTERGITALQMDIKITGVTFDILRDALDAGQRRAHVHPRKDGRHDPDAARAALAVRAAHPDDPDRPVADRPADRQGRRNDPRPGRGVRVPDRRQRRRSSADLLRQRRSRRRARRARAHDDEGGRGRRRVRRQGRQDDDLRRLRRARQGHRRPAAHLKRLARPARRVGRGRPQQRRRDQRARGRGRPRARPHRPASRRRSRTSPASPSRSSPASAPAAAAAAEAAVVRRATAADATAALTAARVATATAAHARRAVAATEVQLKSEHRITTLTTPGSAGGAPGVRIATERVPSVRSVALGFWIATGSAAERDDEAGISHLLEHMLFRGTERFGSQEIDQIFDAMGAEVNAGTDKESTSLYTRVLDGHLPRAFEVMGDMVFHPRFGELETEREVVLEEIAMYEDDPQDKVFDVLGRAIFGAHPLGRAVIGTADVVGSVSREQLAAFHTARYEPQNLVIAAAGSVDHDELVQMATAIDSLRAQDPGAPQPRVSPALIAAPAPDFARRVRFVEKDTEQYHVCLGGAGMAREDERRFALRVLEGVLGATSSSRLFQEVRERRGLAYSVFCFSNMYAHTGEIGLYVGTRPDNLQQASP